MGHLSLALLGAPEVRHDGILLTFPTRKVLALLIYLAVEGGQQSRDKLTALFWPDSDAEHARLAFRRTLALLRQTLGEAAEQIELQRGSVHFNSTAHVDLDLQIFTAATREQGKAPFAAPDAPGHNTDDLIVPLQ